ncbi:MAG: dTMP kinase [Phascolarctobacterium sp.]|uniref:dTMP kinase n=1 Tax=Phascolarctobacterium sp. TaxID=2049039 RepID=UPI0026DADEC4|nr:dTMP kinase [Phascolarctobacterium sp.]MDO4921811.1 dTMP kinase [Phascolarctobacterium sp.]
MRGKFITFEGADGGGKSTQVQLAADYLRRRGCEVVVSREPGGTPLAEKVRALVLDPELPLSNISQTLLYLAARSEHVDKLLRPAVAAGKFVLCDRFSDSTLAYQGLALDKSAEELSELRRLNAFAAGGLTPDLTLLLDGSPEILARRRERRGVSDRYERQGLDYQRKLRQGFLTLAQAEPERIKIIDAEGDLQTVAAAVRRALDALLDGAE